ncbi:MAG: ABC transporter substrate-binding protein [Syntrophaceae bacterium]
MQRGVLLILLLGIVGFCGCNNISVLGDQSVTFRDQEGHVVRLPRHITRISGEGGIVYALRQQGKLVDRGIYYTPEAEAMARLDPRFAARPSVMQDKYTDCEALVALRPQVIFANAAYHRADKEQMERAGLKVFAVKGETMAESFEAVRLMGQVLGCEDKARVYLDDCRRLLNLVSARTRDIPPDKRLKVMFAGPKGVYTVATGEMLQTEIISLAGAENVAAGLKGFWCDVSPEQVAVWNPDVIFLGSSKATYGIDMVYRSAQFKTVTAVRRKRVYAFPSNIGWWDYPAPHCVLGVLWAAKTLYPDRFRDVDMQGIADEFYAKYRGYTFTDLGGRL